MRIKKIGKLALMKSARSHPPVIIVGRTVPTQ